MAKNFLCLFAFPFVFLFFFSTTLLSQQFKFTVAPNDIISVKSQNKIKFPDWLLRNAENPPIVSRKSLFINPVLINSEKGCNFGNLNAERFDKKIDANQRIVYCQAFQEISNELNGNWSPELRSEIENIWQVFLSENVKIRPVKDHTPSNVLAAAEAFTEPGTDFNASLYLRPERIHDKLFLLVFTHELRHIYDFYSLWKTKTSIPAAELEKRGFRIMSKIYQETPDKSQLSCQPNLWKNKWSNLSFAEINNRRESRIEKFMRGNPFYKDLIKHPERHLIGFSANQPSTQTADFNQPEKIAGDRNGQLPERIAIYQSSEQIPQQINQLTFTTNKAANSNNPDELLRAAVANEKNLYQKMDNFVYDQNFRLECWNKKEVSESFQLNQQVARTKDGETLLNAQNNQNNYSKDGEFSSSPNCVSNLEEIKTDATETFWAAPYLDQMPIKFTNFTEVDGIRVARYTVLEPTADQFTKIANAYPKIKSLRVFVGTIFISVEDAQVIKFWGTSFPEENAAGNKNKRIFGSYCATAIRRKLSSGIWVTTLLNTVATVNYKNELRPFSYVVTYQNYRQSNSDVKVLDDDNSAKNFSR